MTILRIFLLFIFFSASVYAQEMGYQDERINVMECSHEEVMAYMKLPDPGRSALQDYEKVSKAIKQVSIKRDKKNPASCASVLYGDISLMAKQLKEAMQAFSLAGGVGLEKLKEFAFDEAVDALMGSICERVNSVSSGVMDAIIDEAKKTREKAIKDLMKNYGAGAAVDYLSDKYLVDDYGVDLQFRNGQIDTNGFRNQVKRKWQNNLDELRDNTIDRVKGN